MPFRFFGITPNTSKPDVQLSASEAERYYLMELMSKHNGNRAAMAREIGVARTTLLYRMRRVRPAVTDRPFRDR